MFLDKKLRQNQHGGTGVQWWFTIYGNIPRVHGNISVVVLQKSRNPLSEIQVSQFAEIQTELSQDIIKYTQHSGKHYTVLFFFLILGLLIINEDDQNRFPQTCQFISPTNKSKLYNQPNIMQFVTDDLVVKNDPNLENQKNTSGKAFFTTDGCLIKPQLKLPFA